MNELTSNLRQRDPVERLALDDLRHGRIDDALGLLQRNGNVTVADNADVLRDVMVAEWFEATTDGSHAVMVALRRDDVADLNRRARLLLQADGRLTPDIVGVNDLGFAEGDRVMAHKNRYDLGILNGDQATITGATNSHVDVKVDDGRRLRLPMEYVAEGHLGHGYALTVHKAQGMTCDEALLLGDDALYAEIGYTGLTRGRVRNRLYTVAATDDLRQPVPGDELSHLRRSLTVSQAKTAAIDVAVDTASPPVPAL